MADYLGLQPEDQALFRQHAMYLLNNLKGDERDDLIARMDQVLPASTKKEIWESNHAAITNAISCLMTERGRMPSRGEIAKKAGVSRTTVYKHLKDYKESDLYQQSVEAFRYMADQVLANIYRYAISGDTKAARLFLEATGALPTNRGRVFNQTNYIQINGLMITQEQITNMKPEHIKQLQDIAAEYNMPTLFKQQP